MPFSKVVKQLSEDIEIDWNVSYIEKELLCQIIICDWINKKDPNKDRKLSMILEDSTKDSIFPVSISIKNIEKSILENIKDEDNYLFLNDTINNLVTRVFKKKNPIIF